MFVLTRNPRAFASRIASTALSKMPSRSTNWSWRSRMPSRWTTQAKYGRRLEEVELLLHQDRVRAEEDELLPLDQLPRDHVHLGVHERLAAGDRDHRRAALLDRRERLRRPASACLRMCSGYWIFPQNEQARLHWKSGSSSTSSGNLSRRAELLLGEVPADRERSGEAGRSSGTHLLAADGTGSTPVVDRALLDLDRPERARARRRAAGRAARAPRRPR